MNITDGLSIALGRGEWKLLGIDWGEARKKLRNRNL